MVYLGRDKCYNLTRSEYAIVLVLFLYEKRKIKLERLQK